eukprot:364408-Chlamydomonas_euryale.AAC.6
MYLFRGCHQRSRTTHALCCANRSSMPTRTLMQDRRKYLNQCCLSVRRGVAARTPVSSAAGVVWQSPPRPLLVHHEVQLQTEGCSARPAARIPVHAQKRARAGQGCEKVWGGPCPIACSKAAARGGQTVVDRQAGVSAASAEAGIMKISLRSPDRGVELCGRHKELVVEPGRRRVSVRPQLVHVAHVVRRVAARRRHLNRSTRRRRPHRAARRHLQRAGRARAAAAAAATALQHRRLGKQALRRGRHRQHAVAFAVVVKRAARRKAAGVQPARRRPHRTRRGLAPWRELGWVDNGAAAAGTMPVAVRATVLMVCRCRSCRDRAPLLLRGSRRGVLLVLHAARRHR